MRSAKSAIPRISHLEADVEKALNSFAANNFRFGTFIMTALYFVALLPDGGDEEARKV